MKQYNRVMNWRIWKCCHLVAIRIVIPILLHLGTRSFRLSWKRWSFWSDCDCRLLTENQSLREIFKRVKFSQLSYLRMEEKFGDKSEDFTRSHNVISNRLFKSHTVVSAHSCYRSLDQKFRALTENTSWRNNVVKYLACTTSFWIV